MHSESLGGIVGQGDRIREMIAGVGQTLNPDTVRAMHAPGELTSIAVPRPGGGPTELVYLTAMADAQRVLTEVAEPLRSSAGTVATVLPWASGVGTCAAADGQLLTGSVLVFAPEGVYALQVPRSSQRSVQEPSTERSAFGPKDALIENLEDDVALIRSHLRDPRLRVEHMQLGTDAPTDVALLYVNGVVDGAMVDEARDRLARYRAPRVGFVSSLLRPLFGAIWDGFLPADFSERPYRIADFLSRGRLAILVDGSPFAMILPLFFIELFIDEEEYLQATLTRYFIRALRMLSFLIAVFGPGLYVAIMAVNPTVVPGLLAVAVASSRQALPYPIFTEILLMLIIIDILTEATVSQKSLLGPAISIVGGLVAGQAAVRANLASNLGVIVVSVTMLATFMTSRLYITYSARIWKYMILVLSELLGLVGWSTGIALLLVVFTSHRQLGAHYLAPLAPLRAHDLPSPSLAGRHRRAPRYVRQPRATP